jgi:hypothetical protein
MRTRVVMFYREKHSKQRISTRSIVHSWGDKSLQVGRVRALAFILEEFKHRNSTIWLILKGALFL